MQCPGIVAGLLHVDVKSRARGPRGMIAIGRGPHAAALSRTAVLVHPPAAVPPNKTSRGSIRPNHSRSATRDFHQVQTRPKSRLLDPLIQPWWRAHAGSADSDPR